MNKRLVYIIAAGVLVGLLLLHRRRLSAQAQNHADTAASVVPGDSGQGDTSGSAAGSSTPPPTPLWGYQWAQAINGTGHSIYATSTAALDSAAELATRAGGPGGRRYVPPGGNAATPWTGPGPNRFA